MIVPPVLARTGLPRVDDVYSVLLGNGDVIYELAKVFGFNGHLRLVWRLPWRAFIED